MFLKFINIYLNTYAEFNVKTKMDLIKNKIKQIDPRIEPKDEKTFIHLIALGIISDKGFERFKCKSKLVL